MSLGINDASWGSPSSRKQRRKALNDFFASSIIPGLRDHLVIVFVYIMVNAPLMNHPNRAGMYQCLLIVNLTFIIFNQASLHPTSPLSSYLVPGTPYSRFPLVQRMAMRKSTTFAVDQADAWSWVALSTVHYGSVIIFSTICPSLNSRRRPQELPAMAYPALSCLVH